MQNAELNKDQKVSLWQGFIGFLICHSVFWIPRYALLSTVIWPWNFSLVDYLVETVFWRTHVYYISWNLCHMCQTRKFNLGSTEPSLKRICGIPFILVYIIMCIFLGTGSIVFISTSNVSITTKKGQEELFHGDRWFMWKPLGFLQ